MKFSDSLIDPNRIALAVQQPWAELILRGVKTLEIRTTSARVRGPIYIYASRRRSDLIDAERAVERAGLDLEALPRGMLLGTAVLTESRPASPDDVGAACVGPDRLVGRQAWRFESPVRLPSPLPVRFQPYGIWFYPFRRRGSAT